MSATLSEIAKSYVLCGNLASNPSVVGTFLLVVHCKIDTVEIFAEHSIDAPVNLKFTRHLLLALELAALIFQVKVTLVKDY